MAGQSLRRRLEPLLRRGFHVYWRFQRGLTLGVRGLVLRSGPEALLVKHSYVSGWHLPGGGVEVGETVHEALARELREEGNISLLGPAQLFGVYFNTSASRRDHVTLFVVRDFREEAGSVAGREIVAHGFFPIQDLPAETTPGTRRRIAEVLLGAPVSEHW